MKAQNPGFMELVSLKASAQARQIAAVYAADAPSLELAGQRVKEALAGQSEIQRPRRFAALI